MYAKLLGFLLFACQIILNGSHFIRETTGDITNFTPTLAPAPSTLPEGYVRFPDLHAAYKVYTTALTWARARRQCIAEGADLAIADTVEKMKRIYAMQSEVHDFISVGIRKSDTSEDWVRVDNGLLLASIPWVYSPDSHPDWDCTGISFGGTTLTNTPCSWWECWYVCEIPMVPVIKSTPTRTPVPSTLPEGYVRFTDLHTAYRVSRKGMPWLQARRQCIAEGADLAIIDTVEKIQRVYDILKDWYITNYISVGIRRSNTNAADWVRVDNGLPLADLPWAFYHYAPYWDCVAINFDRSTLDINPCDAMNSWYVCEISLVPVINSTTTPAPATSTLPEPINIVRSCAKLSYSYGGMVTSFIVLIIVHYYGIQ